MSANSWKEFSKEFFSPYISKWSASVDVTQACVTSTDADHLDIYGEKNSLENSFQEFADKVSNQLIVAKGCKLEGLTYAVEEDADYSISNIKRKNGQYIFDIKTPHKIINEVSFLLPGKHNMMNALAAFAMADCYGIPGYHSNLP